MGVNQSQRMIHIIKPSGIKDDFSIGRGEDVDITLNDITSSDIHAYLFYNEGNWILEDNCSMYGTTVVMKVQMHVDTVYEKAVQVGRSIINFSIEEKDSSKEESFVQQSCYSKRSTMIQMSRSYRQSMKIL